MLDRIGFKLSELYMHIPLHQDTLSQVLSIRNPKVTKRLAYVVHGIKEVQPFLEIHGAEIHGLNLRAVIRTEATWIGALKDQMSVFNFMKEELSFQHKYVIECKLKKIHTNESLFDFVYESRSPGKIYETTMQIEKTIRSII